MCIYIYIYTYIYDSNLAIETFEHLGPVVGTLNSITLPCCFTGL